MKKLLFALAMLVVLPAAADDNFGVKVGQLVIDNTASDATQVGVVYTWDLAGMFGVEGEINTSLADGEASVGNSYTATQLAAYGVFMTPGPVYFKGKAGLAYTDLSFDTGPGATSTDPVYGVGVGFELLGVVMEVEYSIVSADVGDINFVSFAVKF